MQKLDLLLVYDLFASFSKFEKYGLISRVIDQHSIYAKRFRHVAIQSIDDTSYDSVLPRNVSHLTFPRVPFKQLIYFLFSGLLYYQKYSPKIVEVCHVTGIIPALPYKLRGSKFALDFNWDFAASIRDLKGNYWGLFAKWLQILSFKMADIIFAATPLLVDEAKKYIPKEKIILLPNYVDTDLFSPQKLTASHCAFSFKIVFIGRLHEQKNLAMLFKVMEQLPQYSLSIIGDGPMRNELNDIKNNLNLGNIELIGSVRNEELPMYLSKANAFILISHREGHPKALIEAMSCGLPCIGSNVNGIKDVIIDGKTGFLCENDINSIKECILNAFGTPSKMKSVGLSARQFVIDNYSKDAILKKKIDSLHQLTSGTF